MLTSRENKFSIHDIRIGGKRWYKKEGNKVLGKGKPNNAKIVLHSAVKKSDADTCNHTTDMSKLHFDIEHRC